MRKMAGAKTSFLSSNVAMPDGLLMTIKSSSANSERERIKKFPL
jgi:hypothetical protein